MLNDKEIYENGTEVLIFKYIPSWGVNQDTDNYKKGIIIKSEESHDLSYHGSPWYVTNYTVLGEDGYKYFGNYKEPTLGNSFFMTKEDYISFLKRKINYNKEKIILLEDKNKKIIEKVKRLKKSQD